MKPIDFHAMKANRPFQISIPKVTIYVRCSVLVTPNHGARVRSIDRAFVRDVSEIGLLMEPSLLRLFVETASAEDIAELEHIQSGIEALNFDDKQHRALIGAIGAQDVDRATDVLARHVGDAGRHLVDQPRIEGTRAARAGHDRPGLLPACTRGIDRRAGGGIGPAICG